MTSEAVKPTQHQQDEHATTSQAGWGVPRPETIPRPTYHPAAMAFGLTLLFWGFVTSVVVLGAGLVVVAVSLAGSIGEMRNDS